MAAADRDRRPVSSLDDAISWLFTFSAVEDWLFSDPPQLPPEARLVADTYWLNDAALIAKMRRLWQSALSDAPLLPQRGCHRAGWR